MSPILLRRLSDEVLGSRLARGEAAAFDELYRRYVHRLAAYGAQLLGDASAGEDVAQTALLNAYGALLAGRSPERLRPWLYRIAHNTAVDMALRRREAPTESLPEQPSAGDLPPTATLVAAVASLPDRQRDAYVLRELHGLRIDEIADRLTLSVPQIEQALFAARNRLAEQLTFGDRLDCVAVRRLLAGPLDAGERRALKPHLRSCPDCRSQAGFRGRVAGLLGPLDWLRLPLTGALGGGGAPLAAKATAVVATATLGTAIPLADTIDRGSHPWGTAPVTTTHVAPHVHATSRRRAHVSVAAVVRPGVPAASRTRATFLPPQPVDDHPSRIRVEQTRTTRPGRRGTGDGSSDGGRGSGDTQPTPAPAPPEAEPEPTTTTSVVTTTTIATGATDGTPGSGEDGATAATMATTTVDGDGGGSGDGIGAATTTTSSSGDGGSSGGGGSDSHGGSGSTGG